MEKREELIAGAYGKASDREHSDSFSSTQSSISPLLDTATHAGSKISANDLTSGVVK